MADPPEIAHRRRRPDFVVEPERLAALVGLGRKAGVVRRQIVPNVVLARVRHRRRCAVREHRRPDLIADVYGYVTS